MSCTTPSVPPSHAAEAATFVAEFGRQTSKFVDALKLPSPLDPSVLAFRSKSGPYHVNELEDSNIVQPFVQDSVEDAIRGLGLTVDTTAIVHDLVNIVNSFVGGAKTTPTFSGFSTTSYRGIVFGGNVIFKIILAVYIADASRLYDAEPGGVFQLAYHAFLTVQRAN